MSNEDITPSSAPFLHAIMTWSDASIKAWQKEVIERCKDREKGEAYELFIKWVPQENEVAVFTMYANAELPIPMDFDCIFSYRNPEQYVKTEFTLTQSIWEGWYPIDYIDRGHKHLCVLRFKDRIPDLIKQLSQETKKYTTTWDTTKVVGLCQMADIQSIIDRLLTL